MNLRKVLSKSAKLAAILENVAAILDFQMFTYLYLTKYFCANYHASVAFINYLTNKLVLTAYLTLVTLKMTLKLKIDNDIHPHNVFAIL